MSCSTATSLPPTVPGTGLRVHVCASRAIGTDIHGQHRPGCIPAPAALCPGASAHRSVAACRRCLPCAHFAPRGPCQPQCPEWTGCRALRAAGRVPRAPQARSGQMHGAELPMRVGKTRGRQRAEADGLFWASRDCAWHGSRTAQLLGSGWATGRRGVKIKSPLDQRFPLSFLAQAAAPIPAVPLAAPASGEGQRPRPSGGALCGRRLSAGAGPLGEVTHPSLAHHRASLSRRHRRDPVGACRRCGHSGGAHRLLPGHEQAGEALRVGRSDAASREGPDQGQRRRAELEQGVPNPPGPVPRSRLLVSHALTCSPAGDCTHRAPLPSRERGGAGVLPCLTLGVPPCQSRATTGPG